MATAEGAYATIVKNVYTAGDMTEDSRLSCGRSANRVGKREVDESLMGVMLICRCSKIKLVFVYNCFTF